jgi:hypothetical protein
MPRKPKPPQLALAAPPGPAAPKPPPQLPLGGSRDVQLTLEGADFAAVEAAAVELKARFGIRFAVTGRRVVSRGAGLRITAGLRVRPDDALDAASG